MAGTLRFVLFAAALFAFSAFTRPAFAQYSAVDLPAQGSLIHAGLSAMTTKVTYYQFAPVYVGMPGMNVTVDGSLLASETAIPGFLHSKAYVIGGWIWRAADGSLTQWEMHSKYFFTPRVGIQAGMLGASPGKGNPPLSTFMVYDFNGPGHPRHVQPWHLQAGLGAFVDTNGPPSGAFSGFIDGSVTIARGLSLDATYWNFKDSGVSSNRVGLGFGYQL